jgi:hypothetical protein
MNDKAMTPAPVSPHATSTEMARRDTQELFKLGLEPDGLDGAISLCERIAETGMFSGDRDGAPAKPGSLLVRLMTGRELGIPAMAALCNVYEVYGRPALSSRLKVALCLRHPECERFELLELTETSCTYIVKRTGRTEKPYTFTLDEARKAGIVKKDSNWEKWPRRMLVARASGFAADTEFPEAGMGLPSLEEAQDYGEGGSRAGELRGEVVPPQAAKRDWPAESEAIKAALQQAASDGDVEAIKLARAKATIFQTEAPVDVAKDLETFYAKLRREAQAKERAAAGAKPPSAPATKPPASASPAAGPTPAGSTAAGAPTGQAKAKDPDDGLFGPAASGQRPAAEYLPPNRRGDSYEGPENPPPGWTAP